MSIQYTDQSSSKFFQDFRAIHPTNYSQLVRFYEQNEPALMDLSEREYFIILCYYTNALFNLSEYTLHLSYAQKVLEYSMYYNMEKVDNVDIYTFTLHQKAVSHFHTQEIACTKRILEQLIRMDAARSVYLNLLKRCMLAERPRWIAHMMSCGLSSLILTAVCILVQTFVVEPFYAQYANMGLAIQFTLLSAGGVLVLGAVLGHYYTVNRYLKKIEKANSTKISL